MLFSLYASQCIYREGERERERVMPTLYGAGLAKVSRQCISIRGLGTLRWDIDIY